MTAEQIAAGLTAAQRRWLDEAWVGARSWRIVGYRKKACDLGLCHPRSSRLTQLGLEIRAILAKENTDER